MFRKLMLTAALSTTFLSSARAQWTSSRPDGHAPIGVMQDHRHEAGEVMLSYRFMYMNMNGSRVDTDGVTDQSVITPAPDGFGFTVTPTKMPMMMHMLGAMYAPWDDLTLMAMVPYVSSSMDHITRMGGTREQPALTTNSSGIGDIVFSGLLGVAAWDRQTLHFNLGFSVPTGSITQQDVLPNSMGQAVQLPYPMQIGSGTLDVMPGITYNGQADDWSWGGQAMAKLRVGENDRGWKLGNKTMATLWAARRLGRSFGVSLRGEGSRVGNIDGADAAPSVNPAIVPTARTDLRAGTRLDVGVGLNYYIPSLKGLRFAAEGLFPAYQKLDGPQLETDWTIIFGVQIVPIG